jgi:hypothetical protein
MWPLFIACLGASVVSCLAAASPPQLRDSLRRPAGAPPHSPDFAALLAAFVPANRSAWAAEFGWDSSGDPCPAGGRPSWTGVTCGASRRVQEVDVSETGSRTGTTLTYKLGSSIGGLAHLTGLDCSTSSQGDGRSGPSGGAAGTLPAAVGALRNPGSNR